MVIWEKYSGDPAGWDEPVASLGGGFYQSYGWGETRRVAGWQPLRLMAKREGRLVGAASILVKRKLGAAVCWIPGGPVGAALTLDDGFRRVLADELATRFVYCRISLLREAQPEEQTFLEGQRWQRPAVGRSSGLTMLYALSGDEPERLKRASGNWRHNLKRSGRHGLCVEHWASPDLAEMSALYREMEGLKSLPVQHSAAELAAMFQNLGDRIVVYRCLDADGRLLALRAAGLYGTTAWDLLAAAGEAARKVYASHATLWALLDHCQKLGMQHYDLSGVDPVGNKGVYDFKQGTGAHLVECLGEWEWASVPGMSVAVNWLVARKSAGG